MSLVYEALQKAAKEKNRFSTPAPATAPAPTPIPVAVSAAAPKRSAVIWLTALGVVTLLMIAGVMLLRKPTVPPAPVIAPVIVAPPTPIQAPPPVAAPVPERPVINDGGFKLTGIMQLGEEYSAVINGHVVRRNQSVDGAMVKAVEREQVTLTESGRDVVLRCFSGGYFWLAKTRLKSSGKAD